MSRVSASASLLRLKKQFELLGDYEKSAVYAEECAKRAESALGKEQQRAEEKREQERIHAEEREKLRLRNSRRKSFLRALSVLIPFLLLIWSWIVMAKVFPSIPVFLVDLAYMGRYIIPIWLVIALVCFAKKKKR